MDNEAIAGPRYAEWSTDSPNISLTRFSEVREEVTYAAGACREAGAYRVVLRRLIPPRVLGREALGEKP